MALLVSEMLSNNLNLILVIIWLFFINYTGNKYVKKVDVYFSFTLLSLQITLLVQGNIYLVFSLQILFINVFYTFMQPLAVLFSDSEYLNNPCAY